MYTCEICNKEYDDFKEYRKTICRECYNEKQKKIMRKRASTLEGYFQQIITSNKNKPRNNDASKNTIDLTVDVLTELWNKQDGKCALSGLPMEYGYSEGGKFKNPYNCSVDRIDNNKGYVKDNMWLICSSINYFKMNHDLEVVLKISKGISENKKLYKTNER